MNPIHAGQTTRDHPTREQLRAFGQGRLDSDEQSWVEQHVEQCDSCIDLLASLPDDTLLNRLKDCNTSIPGTLAADLRSAGPDDPSPGILAELQDHDRYHIVGHLGQGGMGVVYKAEHRMMGRSVALKVINEKLFRDKTAVDRFHLEVRAAAKLSHPNIVTAHDADQAGNAHFLVMEFVDGINVATQVKKSGPLPVRHACHFARQAAMGLQHAHEMGAVHRDIKPQNLMIARDGRIKILDFGLARLASEADFDPDAAKLTKDGMMLGTPDYMAPEQIIDCRQADIRADVYSLGATLYFMLAARPPFPEGSAVDKMQAHLKQSPPSLASIRSELPGELIAIVERMMAKDLAARYQTPAEVAAALRPFCQTSQPAAAPVAAARPPLRPELEPPEPPLADLPPVGSITRPVKVQPNRASPVPPAAWVAGGLLCIVPLVIVLTWIFLNRSGRGDRPAAVASRDQPPISVVAPPRQNSSHRILMVVPFRDYWGPDYQNVRDELDNAGYHVDIASSQPGEATPTEQDVPPSLTFYPLPVDHTLSEVDSDRYSAVLFTGAWPQESLEFQDGTPALIEAERIVNEMLASGKIVAAICGGTSVLARSRTLDDRDAAVNRFLPDDVANRDSINWIEREVVQADNIITARKDESASALVETLRQRLD